MVQGSVITREMKSLIGVEAAPYIIEIEKEPVRRWAEAIGDTNPLYRDEEYAKKSRYGGMIVPPAFLGNYAYPIKGRLLPEVKSPFTRALNGGNEYEIYQPVRVGDVLTATSKLADLYEKQGRPEIGRMLFRVVETVFKNKKGELVAKYRHTRITYEGPSQ